MSDRYGLVITTVAGYVFPPIVMLAVTIPAVPPATPPPLNTDNAFPLPSVVADAGSTLTPPVWVKSTVRPLSTTVPELFVTFAVMVLLPPTADKVVGTAATVIL